MLTRLVLPHPSIHPSIFVPPPPLSKKKKKTQLKFFLTSDSTSGSVCVCVCIYKAFIYTNQYFLFFVDRISAREIVIYIYTHIIHGGEKISELHILNF